VRPPAHGASVVSIDESSVAKISLPRKSRARQRSRRAFAVAKNRPSLPPSAEGDMVDWAALPDMKDLHSTLPGPAEFSEGYPKTRPAAYSPKRPMSKRPRQGGEGAEGDWAICRP